MVRAGDMRHQVRIETRSTTQDAAGEQQNTWTLFAERRAAVERSPGSEIWASAQRRGRVPTLFRLRHLTGVTPAMRLVFESKIYDIISVVDQGARKEELLITAEEHVESAV